MLNPKVARMNETAKARSAALRYIHDILAGLVPSDTLYDPIYDAVAACGGMPLEFRTLDELNRLQATILALRA